MARYRVKTESDSYYVIDSEAMTFVRLPGAEANELANDFKVVKIQEMTDPPEVGRPFVFKWGESQLRITTPVVEVWAYDAT